MLAHSQTNSASSTTEWKASLTSSSRSLTRRNSASLRAARSSRAFLDQRPTPHLRRPLVGFPDNLIPLQRPDDHLTALRGCPLTITKWFGFAATASQSTRSTSTRPLQNSSAHSQRNGSRAIRLSTASRRCSFPRRKSLWFASLRSSRDPIGARFPGCARRNARPDRRHCTQRAACHNQGQVWRDVCGPREGRGPRLIPSSRYRCVAAREVANLREARTPGGQLLLPEADRLRAPGASRNPRVPAPTSVRHTRPSRRGPPFGGPQPYSQRSP